MTLCVYALSSPVISGIAARGLAGERLRVVAVGSIAAIVGEMSQLPRPTEAHLRKYHRVIQGLSHRTPALLPARYGTLVHDVHELAFILDSRQGSLRRRLTAVRSRVQMTVRLLDMPVARTLRVRAGKPVKARPTRELKLKTGTSYLRARAGEVALARDIPQFNPLRAAVRRWVREERVEKRGQISTVYHLVPRGSVDAYRRALENKARETGVRVVISGPWPAYAFATVS